MPISVGKKWFLALILAGRVTVAAGYDFFVPYPETPEGLPPLCSPESWGQEVYVSEFSELPPESLLKPITLFQKQYAAPAFLEKRKRVRALLKAHPEAPFPVIQPSLASDTLALLKLSACLESWGSAINVLDEPVNDVIPVKERLRAFTAWAALLDRQAGFVRQRMKAWRQAERSAPQTVILMLQAFEAHLSARGSSGVRIGTTSSDTHEKIAKGKYRRNAQVKTAICLLRDYLPMLKSSGGRARHLCLKSRLQELAAVIALPFPALKEKASDFEQKRTLKTLNASMETIIEGLKNFHEWNIPVEEFVGLANRVNGLVVSMLALQSEIIEKNSQDDDWPEFTKQMLSRFTDFSEEVKQIARKVDTWHVDTDPLLDGDDADSCELLFRTYPISIHHTTSNPQDLPDEKVSPHKFTPVSGTPGL